MLKKISTKVLIASIFLITACHDNGVFNKYKTMPNQWHKDSIVTFNITAPDTIKPYNLFLNIRNNATYQYSNLYLIVTQYHPNNDITTDTLEYKMAAPNGMLLGKGFTDIKESKLWYKGYKTDFYFKEKGIHKIEIQHAMRKNGYQFGIEQLKGITDVGLSVELQKITE